MARIVPLLATLRPYLLACAASALALVFAALLAPYAESAPLLAFLAAVALSAWHGGLGPGLVATAFGTAALSVFFAPDEPSTAFFNADTLLDLVTFAAAAARKARRGALSA
jgi:K+-sensing histidine kinase KdpD